ncbi:Aste57867_5352 [Aphanomyces stellatus]|uniref:Aste57867_5352 protein n=1 Tax=Aphanomyces stellatus TaxID=120398 RepID=A0A485KEF1_9STRA|nr:hypothetical protein As57867_005339 [Aphanomyces stellatus]VFT82413.1 Aste57867_5352 [Aphanomyces stellatus]
MIPLTPQEFRQRVMNRLGISWMVETINAIGEDTWTEFVAHMPPLVGDRQYTLSFVFLEAWIVAQEYVQLDGDDEDETAPTLAQYAAALQSIFQFSNTDAIAASVETFHRTAIYVLQEKSTFLAVEAQIDEFSVHLEQPTRHLTDALACCNQHIIYAVRGRLVSLEPLLA